LKLVSLSECTCLFLVHILDTGTGSTTIFQQPVFCRLSSVPPICPHGIMPWWVDCYNSLRKLWWTSNRRSHLIADIALHFVYCRHHRFQYSASHVIVKDAHDCFTLHVFSGYAHIKQQHEYERYTETNFPDVSGPAVLVSHTHSYWHIVVSSTISYHQFVPLYKGCLLDILYMREILPTTSPNRGKSSR
jgi:hypothetical protein